MRASIMTLSRKTDELAGLIRHSGRIALCSHVNPDGDTIGSMLALRLGLTRLGKAVEVFCQDKVPDSLLMLPGAECVMEVRRNGYSVKPASLLETSP